MNDAEFTLFDGHGQIASGPLQSVALMAKRAFERGAAGPVLIFSNATGQSIDMDMSATDEEILAQFRTELTTAESTDSAPAGSEISSASQPTAPQAQPDEARGRGRPKLGVIAREVTLLPRHWEWLSTQPGGASVALRKLVEQARRTHADKDRTRGMIERAYHFILATAGDLPCFEEATRALFANDQQKFTDMIANWPTDVRRHALRLAFADEPQNPPSKHEPSFGHPQGAIPPSPRLLP